MSWIGWIKLHCLTSCREGVTLWHTGTQVLLIWRLCKSFPEPFVDIATVSKVRGSGNLCLKRLYTNYSNLPLNALLAAYVFNCWYLCKINVYLTPPPLIPWVSACLYLIECFYRQTEHFIIIGKITFFSSVLPPPYLFVSILCEIILNLWREIKYYY